MRSLWESNNICKCFCQHSPMSNILIITPFKMRISKIYSQISKEERVLLPLVLTFNSNQESVSSCKNGKIWHCQPSCASCCCKLLISAAACCFMLPCPGSCSSVSPECSPALCPTWQMSADPWRCTRAKDRLFNLAHLAISLKSSQSRLLSYYIQN